MKIYDYNKVKSGSCCEIGNDCLNNLCLTIHTKEGDVDLEYIKHKLRFFLDGELCAVASVEDAAAIVTSLYQWHNQWPAYNPPSKVEASFNIGLVLSGLGTVHTNVVCNNQGYNAGVAANS